MEPASNDTVSPSQSQQKAKGICGVCFSEWKLHHKNGLVHRHGPRNNPCPGSHRLPLVGSPLPPSSDRAPQQTLHGTPGPLVDDAGIVPEQDLVPHPSLQVILLKHYLKQPDTALADC